MTEGNEETGKIDSHLLQYPETVEFSGVVQSSLKTVHISSLAVIAAGILIAINDYPAGLLLLVVFLLIVLAFELWMIKKSVKKLRITLYLRENPVQAFEGRYQVGEIATGTIETQMDNPNELGFRAAPKRRLLTWTFDSRREAETVAKRLLEYLPKEEHSKPSTLE